MSDAEVREAARRYLEGSITHNDLRRIKHRHGIDVGLAIGDLVQLSPANSKPDEVLWCEQCAWEYRKEDGLVRIVDWVEPGNTEWHGWRFSCLRHRSKSHQVALSCRHITLIEVGP